MNMPARFKKMFSAAALAAALGLSLIPTTANAWIVFDPTNWIENAITATNQILTEWNTYEDLIQNTQQTMTMIQSLSTMQGLANAAGLSDELALYQQLAQTASELYGTVQSAQQLYTNLQSQYGASNFTWQNFLNNRNGVNSSRVSSMLGQFQNVQQEIQRVSARRQTLLQKAQDAGTNQSMMQITQVTSAQLDMISGQLQQVTSTLSDKAADDAAQKNDQIQADQFSQDMYRQRQQELLNSANALH
ncbi:hypothetical protein [Noviherbaspirillum pedocola]|uniref:P-type conjugative transfer protein TrbJ n=1 Tax=Noviherbaspirillum pedocola TaxID=2801341 RepID=A0A934W786_9BURK|nr:hypothetical protein [Noviherbaspirillum pedocola]MBK4736075.1 hypothetical protein [Noviherbaspirillum pedocola]